MEVQSIIISYVSTPLLEEAILKYGGCDANPIVQLRDLGRLCCTCKTLNAVVLPTLYHTIELNVPLRWSRLPSLKNLLASLSEGFKYTKYLRIVTKLYPQKDNICTSIYTVHETGDEDDLGNDREPGDEEDPVAGSELDAAEREEIEEDDALFRVYNPGISASEAPSVYSS